MVSLQNQGLWSRRDNHLLHRLAHGATGLQRGCSTRAVNLVAGSSAIYGWSNASATSSPLQSPHLRVLNWSLDLSVDAGKSGDTVLEAPEGKGEVRRLTRINQDLLDSRYLSIPEEVEVEAYDGLKLQAWVMKPIGMQDGKAYPVILHIHGGPHSAYGFAFFHQFQVLASRGYGVVFGNRRQHWVQPGVRGRHAA